MRVFHTTYKTRDGQTKQAAKWYVELRDHLDTIRRFPGFPDRRQTEALGRQIERLVRCRMGGERPDSSLARWLEQIPPKLMDRFVSIGLIDSGRAAAGKPLVEHIKDFRDSLLAKGNTAMYVQTVISRTQAVMNGCKSRVWSDVRADRVERYLADLRSGGLSIQTTNFYLQSAQQFCRWMIRNGRASESPLAHLRGLNVRTDRRHDRTTLEVDEVRRLLAATEHGPERYGMGGRERALLYRLTVETGLRRKELRSLKVSSFDLAAGFVTVRAGYSKRRREDTLPLRPETVVELRAFFAGRLPTAKAFGGRYRQLTDKTAPMIRADLAEAGIDYTDAAGRFRDFHALRHTTGSWLAANGVHPKVAQAIMRHSDINLTMSRYTHLFRGQEAAAIAKLPDLSTPNRQAQKATGTDGKPGEAPSDLAFCLAREHGKHRTDMDSGGHSTPTGDAKNAFLKANGRIRTDNPWFTKPELYH